MSVEMRNMPEARPARIGLLNAGDVPSGRAGSGAMRERGAAGMFGMAGALLGSGIAGTRISPEILRCAFATTMLATSA